MKPSSRLRRFADKQQGYEGDPWAEWLVEMFPAWVSLPDGRIVFADYHRDAWAWAWAVGQERPPAFFACWPRDSGKSTHAELIAAYLGCEGKRSYCIYVCGTQARADDHVQNMQALLEAKTIAARYPAHAERKFGKFSQSLGWRVNRLRTEGGFTVDAIGLDRAVRGARMEEQRPDLIILDDIDDRHDSARMVLKKEEKLTHTIIPAGNRDTCAVIFPQNLIHGNSVMARLVYGKADYLRRRKVSGPYPALRKFKYEVVGDAPDTRTVVTGGEPVWEGLTRSTCQDIIEDIGITAFLREYQQEVKEGAGALWTQTMIDNTRAPAPATATMAVVSVDPAVSSKSRLGSETGIVRVLYAGGHAYVVNDASGYYSPDEWAKVSLRLYDLHPHSLLVGEKNNGGELVETNVSHQRPSVNYVDAWASKGKFARAEECVALYERGLVHHVGTLAELEAQMTTPYDPVSTEQMWDHMDALVWALHTLFFRADREDHFDRAKHVVEAKKNAVPVYVGVEKSRVEEWMVKIESGVKCECTRDEYGPLRRILTEALYRFSRERDPRGAVVAATLEVYDLQYGREAAA